VINLPCAALLAGFVWFMAQDRSWAEARVDHAAEYEACLDLAGREPAKAYESGLAWLNLGGGIPARHCIAVAMIGLDQFDSAAARFETLAGELNPDQARLRAEMLGQAGQAWLLAGRPARAAQVQGEALLLSPEDAALHVDRAASLMTLERYAAALADLDRALTLAPDFADARLYRATARRHIDDLDGAWTDVMSVLEQVPGLPAAVLERGILRQLAGDLAGARLDWLAVIESAPDSAEAGAARARIEEMDLVRD